MCVAERIGAQDLPCDDDVHVPPAGMTGNPQPNRPQPPLEARATTLKPTSTLRSGGVLPAQRSSII